jgi:hypothetical protein
MRTTSARIVASLSGLSIASLISLAEKLEELGLVYSNDHVIFTEPEEVKYV